MILSFKHKGLEQLFYSGLCHNINPRLLTKIRLRLGVIHHAKNISDINLPGFNLHKLKGERQNSWSVSVTGNFRITFEFNGSHAYFVNYEDYH